mmetsp:Transcript_22695/g.33741  ORF Transcript_22695/g.33741 Transcript_22695/m.33741 type:complete len:293 (+) Transcript_22695:74-952(+)
MSETKPSTAATSNDGKQKRRSKVSFSEEVISKDKIGDGNKVLVEEEPGVFLSLLGQKRVVKTNENEINGAVVDRVATISFGGVDDDDNDDLLKQKLAYSEKQDGNIIMQSPTESRAGSTSDGVEYDNLIVKIGLLKIGHRYRMIVPIPNRWGQDVNEDNEQHGEKHTHNNDEVKIIEDSFDDDLRGEIETEHTNTTNDAASSTTSAACHHYLNITLSAKRRGPYRGRFVLELTRYPLATSSETPQKCIMSVQVDATIMGKDMGTPKLRNGVICLGKIVGYDSDDETEWQGFD